MANVINANAITSNPKEVQRIQEVILAKTYNSPEFQQLYTVIEGVNMKEQIQILGNIDGSGILDDGCTPVSTGAEAVMTEKYWEPALIGDSWAICKKSYDSMLKIMFAQVKRCKEFYELDSDQQALVVEKVSDAMKSAINRLIWFGNKAVSGLVDSTKAPLFTPIDGVFAQIDASSDVVKITNPYAGQAITNQQAQELLETVVKGSDSRIEDSGEAVLYVSRDVYDAIRFYGVNNSLNFTLDKLENGLEIAKWCGIEIHNMGNVWRAEKQYFSAPVDTRIVYTYKSNLQVATTSTDDFGYVEIVPDAVNRQEIVRYNFMIDAKIIDDACVTILQ